MALSNLTKLQTVGIGSNIEVVGVITTGQFKSGTSNLHSTGVELTNLNVSGIATIGGNLSIGGTLTYQDVTNIDSVGLITARNGINVSGGNLTIASGGKVGIGTDTPNGDLQIRAGQNASFRVLADPSTSGLFVGNYGSGDGYRSLSLLGSVIRLHTVTAGSLSGATEKVTITSAGQIKQTAASGDTIFTFKRSNTNTTGAVGVLNFAASDDHSVANIQVLGDGDNEGAHILFKTTSAAASADPFNAATVERLRITSSGDYLFLGGTLRIKDTANSAQRGAIYGDSSAFYINAGANLKLYSGGGERLVFDNNGNIAHTSAGGVSSFTGSSEYIFGSTTSSPPAGGSEANVQIHDYKTRAQFSINAYMNNAGGPFMNFLSSRSGTVGTLGTKCLNGDSLGDIRFTGDNGTNYNSIAYGAQIYATAASTPGDGDTVIAGRLKFVTGTASGGSTPVVMELREDGLLNLKRGRVNDAGHMVYRAGGRIVGTATVSFDVPVSNDGNIYWIEAFYTHHSLSYGGYLYGVYGAYSAHSGLQINNTIGSSTAGGTNVGTWSVSRGSAGTPIVVAKSAGSYGGAGHYWIHVHAGLPANL